MPYTNFAQFVGYHVPGQDLKLSLSKDWNTAKPKKGTDLVIVTQPSVRRALGIMETPLHVTISANDERLQDVLAKNSNTARNHVAKFDLQAENAKKAKAGRQLMDTIAQLLGN